MSPILDAPTRIAIMIGQLAQGGSEGQMYAFLEHCDRERWAPMVYVSGELGPWNELICELGIPITLLRGGPVTKMWQFRQSCRANRVRRFFSWSAYTNGYGMALQGLDIPCIGSFRAGYPLRGLDRIGWLRSWMSLAAVDTVVCNSQEAAVSLRKRAGNRKRVIYVPNSLQPIENVELNRTTWRKRLEISASEALILGVGRLTPQKNFGRFIETVALVSQRLPVRAVVAGRDDGLLESLRRQIDASGLGPGVIDFIGLVPDARELICAADIFLLSSDYEGMPNVVMEAMSAGVPCVCTKVNGVDSLIEHGVNGFITDHRANSLADEVLRLVEDKKLRGKVGRAAAESVRVSFDPKTIAARLWQLCE